MNKKLIKFKEIAIRVGDSWKMMEDCSFQFDDLVVGEPHKECPTLFHAKLLWEGEVVVETLLNAQQIKETEEALFEA